MAKKKKRGVSISTQKVRFFCPLCGKDFRRKQQLEAHALRSHGTEVDTLRGGPGPTPAQLREARRMEQLRNAGDMSWLRDA